MFWVEGGEVSVKILILSIFCSDKNLVPELSSQAKEAMPGMCSFLISLSLFSISIFVKAKFLFLFELS